MIGQINPSGTGCIECYLDTSVLEKYAIELTPTESISNYMSMQDSTTAVVLFYFINRLLLLLKHHHLLELIVVHHGEVLYHQIQQ